MVNKHSKRCPTYTISHRDATHFVDDTYWRMEILPVLVNCSTIPARSPAPNM